MLFHITCCFSKSNSCFTWRNIKRMSTRRIVYYISYCKIYSIQHFIIYWSRGAMRILTFLKQLTGADPRNVIHPLREAVPWISSFWEVLIQLFCVPTTLRASKSWCQVIGGLSLSEVMRGLVCFQCIFALRNQKMWLAIILIADTENGIFNISNCCVIGSFIVEVVASVFTRPLYQIWHMTGS